MRLKIIFVLNLILLVTANAQSTENQLRCEETAACTCFDYNEIEIQCPKFEPHVIVRIQPNNYVHFECENMTGNEYELVPHYELDTAAFLQITKCTLMDGKSIMDTYLKNFKFNRIRNFQFVSSGANKHINFQQSHFRGLGNVERFDLRGNEDEIAELPEDLFVDMKNLSWVRIRVAKIYLPDNLFAPLDKLEFLELGHNKLETLPKGFLRNQKKLVQLNLWGNSLMNLKKDSFVGLNLVRELDLSGNKMESLESDVLYHLTNLTDINLSGNNFEALPDDLFQNNRKLKYVRLLENRVPMNTLPKGLFANLTELTHVALKADLQTLPEDVFEGSYNIVQLKLDKNLLNNLPAGLLYHQVNLEKLDLQDNLIESLADSFFSKTTSLKELYLSGNMLTTINENMFNRLTKLTHLYMNNNLITTLDSRAFSKTPMLEYITLENNNISFKTFPASPFQMLQKLEKLNLANNSINFVFEDFTLISLKLLNLSYNKIDMLSTSQLNNIKTEEIDLTYNEIMEINNDNDVNENITVRLNHNPLSCDCRVHKFVKYLKEPKIDKNNQKIILITDDLRCAEPEQLADLKINDIDPFDLICSLDSKDTKAPKCPKECKCLRRPEDSHILLECSPTLDFSSLPVLESHKLELSIVSGNLTELPVTLRSANSRTKSGYGMVTNLTISNNQISTISLENLPPELKILDVRNNSLETLNETVRDFLRPNVTLYLGGNPWRCDCANKGFIDFVQIMIHGNNVSDPNDIKCENGQDLLRDVYLPKLCKENENMLIIILCIITAIIGTGFGGFAALYYKYQKQIKMWLYSHNMLLWFVTEEELDKDKRYDAFVSYSHRDNDFVADHLLPELENGTIPYKLCVHERDWHPGLEISTQISNSVNDAKRTIIVLSPNYLRSDWAQWEFRVAQSHAATEKRSRIIVILYGDIGDINKLEPEIRDYLKCNTYVKWGDKWFWEKLKYAMPHVNSAEKLDRGNGLVKSAMKSSVDDKLELIKPISVTPPMLTTPPAEKVANPLIAKLNAKNAANLNGKAHNGYNGHINGAYVINTSSRQSDV